MKRGRCLSQVAVVVVGVWEACLELPREQARGRMRVVLHNEKSTGVWITSQNHSTLFCSVMKNRSLDHHGSC